MENKLQEIPPDIQLVMLVNSVRREYCAWRVVAYEPDGSWYFVPNNSGYDYKRKYNAEQAACLHNNSHSESFAVVKKVKMTEIEVE